MECRVQIIERREALNNECMLGKKRKGHHARNNK